MREFIAQIWNLVMDYDKNPLKHVKDLQTRHLLMQLLAWMWCIIFASSMGSYFVFGLSAIIHSLLIAGIVFTVATFKIAENKPEYFGGFGRSAYGEHE
ncbi:hypothetical protein OAW28_05940 [Alphaproteobacteria bacterium]|jgi:hypothetical protein|nr:hypothetical protein [Alphaproteobacteria bacterium]MDC3312172.1 hypothetical protein [Alphaproteobacteria bacterium]